MPACEDADVLNVVRGMLREAPLNKARGVTGFRFEFPAETLFQNSPPKRFCRAVMHTYLATERIYYAVSWQKKSQGVMWVEG